MNKPLLNGNKFPELAKNFEMKIKEVEFNTDQVFTLADDIRDGRASDQKYHQYNVCLKNLEIIFGQLEDELFALEDAASNQKENSVVDRFKKTYKMEKDNYSKCLSEFQVLTKNRDIKAKMMKVGNDSNGSSLLGSQIEPFNNNGGLAQQKDQEIGVAKIYDQEQYVAKRGEKIVNIKMESKAIKDVTEVIHQKVYEQDEQLDALNKQMGNAVQNVKKGNRELEEAKETTKKSNKNMLCLLLLIIILLAALGISLYVVYGFIL